MATPWSTQPAPRSVRSPAARRGPASARTSAWPMCRSRRARRAAPCWSRFATKPWRLKWSPRLFTNPPAERARESSYVWPAREPRASTEAVMSEIPKELRYTKDHEWARIDGDMIEVGITAYAIEQLGDVTLVDLPAPGLKLIAHKR